jgi:hypothetical protein
MVTVPYICPDAPQLTKNPLFLFYSDGFQKPYPFKANIAVDDRFDQKISAILKDTSKPDIGTLHLIRSPKSGVFILWSINHDVVTAAIKSGELQGSITPNKDGPHSSLATDPQNYPKLLSLKFWKWTEPAVMTRVTRP